MKIRPKTKRRLVILVVVLLLAGGGVVGFAKLKKRAARRAALPKREQAIAAYERDDYRSARDLYEGYFLHHPMTVEDWYRYGRSVRRVEEPNRKHVERALKLFRRIVRQDPSHVGARKDLLEVYGTLGYGKEAVRLAEETLEIAPGDPDVLAGLVVAHLRTGADGAQEEALAAARELNAVAPRDLRGHFLTLRALEASRADADRIVEHAVEVQERYPDDPRFLVLRGRANAMVGRMREARTWFGKAASAEPPDADFVRLLVDDLDRAGMHRRAFEVLEGSQLTKREPVLRRKLMRRLWNAGRTDRVLELAASLDPDPSKRQTEVLALQALALAAAGREEEAAPLLEELERRTADPAALAWHRYLAEVRFRPEAPAKEHLEICRRALEADPGNPWFQAAVGNAYARLGEQELAVHFWTSAARLAPDWARPLVLASRLLSATGRVRAAIEALEEAHRRAPGSLGVALGHLMIQYERLDDLDEEETARLRELVERVREAAEGEPLSAALRVELLAREGRTEEAAAALREALAAGPALPEAGHLQLATVSRRHGLGLETECLRRCREVHGPSPELAFRTAGSVARREGPEKGLEAFDEVAASAPEAGGARWALQRTRYRATAGGEEAGPLWISLADEWPEDLDVQRAALEAPATWSDRDAVARLIERVRALTGEHGFLWRMSRARWLLADGEPDNRDAAEAARLLGEIIRTAPDLLSPRLLQARALEALGDVARAVQELTAVTNLGPRSAIVHLELARLYQDQGDRERVRDHLLTVIRTEGVRSGLVSVAAARLSDWGWSGEAVEALDALRAERPGVGEDLTAARVYLRAGRFREAESLGRKLLDGKDPEAVVLVADALAMSGRREEAARFIDRLDDLPIPPSRRLLLRAGFETRFGDEESARSSLLAATHAEPENPRAWRELLVFRILEGKPEETAATLAEARAALPADETFAYLDGLSPELLALVEEPACRPAVVGLVESPGDRETLLRALEAFAAAEETGRAEVIDEVVRLADRNPDVLALQNMAVDLCAGDGRLEKMSEVANRVMRAFPLASRPARVAAQALARHGRWEEALAPAKEWRRRSPLQAAPADRLLAGILLELDRPREAAERLQPRVERAAERPHENRELLALWARARIRSGDADLAAERLRPLLSHSAAWRRTYALLGASWPGSERTSVAWIEEAAANAPEDSGEDLVNLALAWKRLADRTDDPGHRARFREALAEATAREDLPLSGRVEIASLHHELGNRDAAIAAYEETLETGPRLPAVANNLAMLLAGDPERRDRALELAREAVRAEPGNPEYLDTLAHVHRERGDRAAAARRLEEAVRIAPGALKFYVPLLEDLLALGRWEDLARTLRALDARRGQGAAFPEELPPRLDAVRRALRER